MPVLRDELLLERRAADLARELARGREPRVLEAPVGEVALEVRADQLLAVVAEHELEGAVDVGDLLVHRHRADRLVRVLEQVAVAILALARGRARARPLDRDGGQVRGELDEIRVAVGALAGLAVVQRERAEQGAVRREERRRPARAQRRTRRHLADALPQRVRRDVRDEDALAPEGGAAARSCRRADHDAVDALVPEVGQARPGAVAQVHAVTVHQEDRREQRILGVLLDEARDAVEHERKRGTRRDELEQRGLGRRQRLRALELGHVEHVALRADRRPLLVAHQHALVAQPHDAPVAMQHAVLDLRAIAGLEHARRLLDDALAIVGVQDAHEEVGARRPVLRRVAEHGGRLRADVQVRRAGFRRVDVHDQRQALDEAAVVAGSGQRPCIRARVIRDATNVIVAGAHTSEASERCGCCLRPRGARSPRLADRTTPFGGRSRSLDPPNK